MYKKVLFFFPPYRHLTALSDDKAVMAALSLPLGLASVAMYLRAKADIAAHVYCAPDHSPAQIERTIRAYRPDVIGISCWSYNRFACFELARMVKRIDPAIVVVLGGVHATFLDKQVLLNYPDVDFIIRGEGEVSFLELLKALAAGGAVRHVHGVTSRRGEGVVRAPERSRLKTLEDLPTIDYQSVVSGAIPRVVWGGDYSRHISSMPVETSRGCPFACSFCAEAGFMGHVVARRSVAGVMEQVARIEALGHEGFYFHDMNFTLDREYTQALCAALVRHKMKTPWVCSTRINLVDKDLLMCLKKAGCRGVFYGVDSLAEKVLHAAGRHYSPGGAIENVNLTLSVGMFAQVNIIVGFPGETQRDRVEVLRNITKIHADTDVVVHGLMILPGSQIYQLSLREGFDESYWLSDHDEVLPLYPGTLSREAMQAWVQRLYTAFKG